MSRPGAVYPNARRQLVNQKLSVLPNRGRLTTMRSLLRVKAQNFRSLRDVNVALRPVSVLVGPNGAGKTTLLRVIAFLGEATRHDLTDALAAEGGFERVAFRGHTPEKRVRVVIEIFANVTKNAHEDAPDRYRLEFFRPGKASFGLLGRKEEFQFKRTNGPGRRITISGNQYTFESRTRSLREGSLGLATLPKLGPSEGGEQVEQIANLFASFRVFDADVRAARLPVDRRQSKQLASDASNLSAFLEYLSLEQPEAFEQLCQDARRIVPNLEGIGFRSVGGASDAVVVELNEAGLESPTPLADASFGTIRALALLALLHDPAPPRLTCMEEIDHGLHPWAFDLVIERVRQASSRTQFLIATHSPALVNRLNADELIVCERDPVTGASRIPAISSEDVRTMEAESGSDLRLGELWFTGSLGGIP